MRAYCKFTVISGFIGLTVPVSVVYSEMSEASQTRQEWESACLRFKWLVIAPFPQGTHDKRAGYAHFLLLSYLPPWRQSSHWKNVILMHHWVDEVLCAVGKSDCIEAKVHLKVIIKTSNFNWIWLIIHHWFTHNLVNSEQLSR